jgi:hypothetical protein
MDSKASVSTRFLWRLIPLTISSTTPQQMLTEYTEFLFSEWMTAKKTLAGFPMHLFQAAWPPAPDSDDSLQDLLIIWQAISSSIENKDTKIQHLPFKIIRTLVSCHATPFDFWSLMERNGITEETIRPYLDRVVFEILYRLREPPSVEVVQKVCGASNLDAVRRILHSCNEIDSVLSFSPFPLVPSDVAIPALHQLLDRFGFRTLNEYFDYPMSVTLLQAFGVKVISTFICMCKFFSWLVC